MFNHCASKNALSKSKSAFDTIYFGKSGGFANVMERYALEQNGKVFKEIDGKMEKINKIKRSGISEINEKLDSLHFETINPDDVGNMTWFIEVISDTTSHKVTWTQSTEDPGLKDLYQILVSTLQKNK